MKKMQYLNSKYFVCENGDIINSNTDRKIRPQNNGNGYKKVTLTINGEQVQKYVHRLVAECFLLNKSIQVNHKDCNKSNNHVDNLEWVTNSENQIHAHKTGLKKNGNQLWNGKFNKEQISEMKLLRSHGMFYYEIAERFNTTKGTVHAIINDKRYKYV